MSKALALGHCAARLRHSRFRALRELRPDRRRPLPRPPQDAATVDREVKELAHQIKLLGAAAADGRHSVTFGPLFDATQDIFEALGGTLKTAKKRGVVAYEAPILLKGPSDKVVITLLKEVE